MKTWTLCYVLGIEFKAYMQEHNSRGWTLFFLDYLFVVIIHS